MDDAWANGWMDRRPINKMDGYMSDGRIMDKRIRRWIDIYIYELMDG